MIRWAWHPGESGKHCLGELSLPLGWTVRLTAKPALGAEAMSSSGFARRGPVVGRIWSVAVYGPGQQYGSVEIELHGTRIAAGGDDV